MTCVWENKPALYMYGKGIYLLDVLFFSVIPIMLFLGMMIFPFETP